MHRKTLLLLILTFAAMSFFVSGFVPSADAGVLPAVKPTPVPMRPGSRVAKPRGQPKNTGAGTVSEEQSNGLIGEVLEGTGIKAKPVRNNPGSSAPANNPNMTQSQPATTTVKAKKPRKRKP